MNDEPTDPATGQAKKPPRKPRPSEIAAKKAKAAAKRKKPAKRKAPAKSKSKAKRKPAPKAKHHKGNGRPLVRTERLDMRVTKADRRKLEAKARAKKRTVTSIVLEAIAKLR